jgi:hypothetical protein
MNFVNIQQVIAGLVDEVKKVEEVEERRRRRGPNVIW